MKFLYDIVICLIVYLLIMQSNIIHMIGEYMRTIDNDNTKQTTFSEFNNKNVVNAAISGHQPTTIRQYKDNVFCLLYRDKNNLLDLYNGLNDTNYTNVDDLTVTTLKGGVYMKYKNDASFVFGQDLYMFEQQSSRNPNMPLRFLHYLSDVYRQMYNNSDLHRSNVEVRESEEIGRLLVERSGGDADAARRDQQQVVEDGQKIDPLEQTAFDSTLHRRDNGFACSSPYRRATGG